LSDNSGITPQARNRLPHSSAAASTSPQTDARLGRIVRVLMRFPTVVISGTKLAQEIGVTRSEVWRLVQQLRETEISMYTLKDTPIFSCVRVPTAEMLDRLG